MGHHTEMLLLSNLPLTNCTICIKHQTTASSIYVEIQAQTSFHSNMNFNIL